MTHEGWLDEQMTEWLAAGPHDVPSEPIHAAVAHARTHPRRRLPAAGLGRRLMNRTHVTTFGQRTSGRLAWAAAGVAVIVLVLVVSSVLLAGGFDDQHGQVVGPVTNPTSIATEEVPSGSPSEGALLESTPVAAALHCRVSWGIQTPMDGNVTHYLDGSFQGCSLSSPDVRGQTAIDPRLTGTVYDQISMDWFQPDSARYPRAGGDAWASSTIMNDGGTWTGWWTRHYDTIYGYGQGSGVLIGNGTYAGLRFRYTTTGGLDWPTDPEATYVGITSQLAGVIEPVDSVPPGGATIVTASVCGTGSQGTETVNGDVTEPRGVVLDCTTLASDPRLGGVSSIEIDIYEQSDLSADMTGTTMIDGPDGTWSGPFTGTIDSGFTTHRATGVLTGAAAYEGLVYRYTLIGDESGYVLTGTIASSR